MKFTIGTVSSNMEFSETLKLIKSSLLYADEIELIGMIEYAIFAYLPNRILNAKDITHLLPKWGSPLYILLCLILVALFMCVYKWIGKNVAKRSNVVGWRRSKSGKKASVRLRKAEQLLNEKDDVFCAEILNAFKLYIAEHYNVGMGEISKQKIAE